MTEDRKRPEADVDEHEADDDDDGQATGSREPTTDESFLGAVPGLIAGIRDLDQWAENDVDRLALHVTVRSARDRAWVAILRRVERIAGRDVPPKP